MKSFYPVTKGHAKGKIGESFMSGIEMRGDRYPTKEDKESILEVLNSGDSAEVFHTELIGYTESDSGKHIDFQRME